MNWCIVRNSRENANPALGIAVKTLTHKKGMIKNTWAVQKRLKPTATALPQNWW